MTEASGKKALRWWPAAVIVVLAATALGFLWLRESSDHQRRVVLTLLVGFLTTLLLVVWLLLFSRLRARVRLRIAGGLFAAGALAAALWRIEGVSGNFVPVVTWRWSAARWSEAGGPAATTALPGAGDYPQFRGPGRDATLAGPELVRDWTTQPPRELWRVPVGEGWSAFAVAGPAAVTQEQRGDEEAVVRYDLATGEVVWSRSFPARFDRPIGGVGPRATPAIDGGQVFSLGATGILSALDLASGEVLWHRNVVEDHGAAVPEWGKSCSPLVLGDKVIVSAGGGGGWSLVAYDRATGDVVWHGGSDRSSYSSPRLLVFAGVPQIVIVNKASVAAHHPDDGRVLWSVPWPGEQANVAMPLAVGDDLLLVSKGYGVGAKLFRIHLVPQAADGATGEPAATEPGTAEEAAAEETTPDDGEETTPDDRAGDVFTVEMVWESPRLKSKFAGMVQRDGMVYGLDDGVLVCLDSATGERRWKRGRYGHGQLILVDDLLLIQAENGDVVLVEADPDRHVELGRLPALGDKTWNPPVLAGRYLLVRNHREAAAYELPTR